LNRPEAEPEPQSTIEVRNAAGAPDSRARRGTLHPTLARMVLALALGGAGGWIASLLAVPLPWMIGAMLSTTIGAAFGLPIAIDMRLRALMVAVLGVMLGSGFTPAILGQMAAWSLSLAGLALYSVVAGGLAWLYFHKVCRYDRVTSYFAAMPGGLSEMILVGTEMGGDTRIISLSQSSRLLLVVLILPFGFQFFLGYDPAAKPAAGLPLGDVSWQDLGVLAACGIAGYFGAKAVRMPAAAVVGPMILSAIVHLAGWSEARPPFELVAAAQVVVGSAIGCRFAGVTIHLVLRAVGATLGSTAILLAVNIAFAAGLYAALDLPIKALMLAYAPGGLAEMSLIAIAVGTDAAFVATHHIVRIFLIVVFAPLAFRLMTRKSRAPRI
jgi:membrane AbrB-like protein